MASMTPDERAEMLAQAREALARIHAAHTPENLARLRAAIEARGGKLTGTMQKKSGFKLRFADGNSVSGLTLAAVDSLLTGARTKSSG